MRRARLLAILDLLAVAGSVGLAGCSKTPVAAQSDAAADASAGTTSVLACSSGLIRAPHEGYVALGVARDVSCAVHSSGRVACWGTWGSSSCEDPAWIDGLASIKDIVAGSWSTFCAFDAGRQAWCWGTGWSGTPNGTGESSTPQRAPALDGAMLSLAPDGEHACKVDAKGALTCWGRGDQLGVASADFQAPRQLLTGAKQVAAGRAHNCATSKDGTLRCWGDGEIGALGDGVSYDRGCRMESKPSPNGGLPTHHQICAKPKVLVAEPRALATFTSATQVASGTTTSCALQDKRVWCWGSTFGGTPRAIAAEGVVDLAGSDTYCARTSAGLVTCWGLGQGSPPERVSALEPATAIAARWDRACALVAKGSIRCLGKNRSGLPLADWTAKAELQSTER